jgi:hypothetical protein
MTYLWCFSGFFGNGLLICSFWVWWQCGRLKANRQPSKVDQCWPQVARGQNPRLQPLQPQKGWCRCSFRTELPFSNTFVHLRDLTVSSAAWILATMRNSCKSVSHTVQHPRLTSAVIVNAFWLKPKCATKQSLALWSPRTAQSKFKQSILLHDFLLGSFSKIIPFTGTYTSLPNTPPPE